MLKKPQPKFDLSLEIVNQIERNDIKYTFINVTYGSQKAIDFIKNNIGEFLYSDINRNCLNHDKSVYSNDIFFISEAFNVDEVLDYLYHSAKLEGFNVIKKEEEKA